MSAFASSAAAGEFVLMTAKSILSEMTAANFVLAPVLNRSPTDIALSSATVSENSTTDAVIGTLSAVDPDSGEVFTISLKDNPDNRFAIDGFNLVVAGALDFESTSAYQITVRVTDSATNTFDKEFVISIADANDRAPTITTAATQSIPENTTFVAILTSTDVDTVGINPALFSITGGADPARFGISGGNLVFNAAPDYEAGQHTFEVQVSADDGSNTTNKTITVDVLNAGGVIITGTGAANTTNATATVAGQPFPTNEEDVINGAGGADNISGLGGDDLIDGGARNDVMAGGPGNDTYVVASGGDSVVENSGEGADTIQASVTYTLPATVENLALTGAVLSTKLDEVALE